ncbi:MAG: hypothetical protein ACYDGM_11580 [Vulcanimicrobiaceae bacterium]
MMTMTSPDTHFARYEQAFAALRDQKIGDGCIVPSCCKTCAMVHITPGVRDAATWVVVVAMDGRQNEQAYTDDGWMMRDVDMLCWGGDGAAIVAALRSAGLDASGGDDPSKCIRVANGQGSAT